MAEVRLDESLMRERIYWLIGTDDAGEVPGGGTPVDFSAFYSIILVQIRHQNRLKLVA